MSNLYQDAILDAKALRASAMANAKAALEEAFEPKIQEMISKHLSEEAVEENLEEDWNEDGVEEGEKMPGEKPMEETTDINEAELEEILNQLEEMSAPKEESLNEAEKDDEEPEEETEDDDEEGGEEGEPVEEVTDETKVIEITVGDLKQILQSVMPGQEMPAAEPEGPEAAGEEAAGDEVTLEEILDELENEGMETAQGGAGDVAKVDTPGEQLQEGGMDVLQAALEIIQNTPSVTVDVVADKINQMFPSVGLDAAINLAKTLLTFVGGGLAVGGARKAFPGVKKTMDTTSAVGSAPKGLTNFEAKDAELKEAKATIETLRRDLQEVNLLNAKYLYMNKLFKGKSLTEAQKLKVINTLDKATTVKEVKTAYELMNESFSTNKGQLKESVGFASKPAGVAPKANIVEADQFVSRWQKLAGIK